MRVDYSKLRKHCHWILLLVMTCELFWIQELTLKHFSYFASYQPVLHRLIRLALSLTGSFILIWSLHKWKLMAVLVSQLILGNVVLCYHTYQGQPLGFNLLTENANEGVAVIGGAFAVMTAKNLIPWLGFVLKSMVLKCTIPKIENRFNAIVSSIVVYVAIITSVSFYKPLTLITGWESFGGLGSLYGYVPTWIAESLFFDKKVILAKAVARSKEQTDRLGRGVEREYPLKDLVVAIQVESLDTNVLNLKIRDKPVMPFLSKLSQESLTYNIRAEKKTGSCDSDFTFLTGFLPSEFVPNYKIVDFEYSDTTSNRFANLGFETSFIHNITGKFFNRRQALTKIGFEHLVFLEELEEQGAGRSDVWSLPDGEMFNWIADKWVGRVKKQFIMVVTATSHIPFDYVPDSFAWKPVVGGTLFNDYVKSMAYVDQKISLFVDGLPDETLLLIYGDHDSKVEDELAGYKNVSYEGVGLVPFMLYSKSEGQHSHFKSAVPEALRNSGELTLQDVVLHVRRSLQ